MSLVLPVSAGGIDATFVGDTTSAVPEASGARSMFLARSVAGAGGAPTLLGVPDTKIIGRRPPSAPPRVITNAAPPASTIATVTRNATIRRRERRRVYPAKSGSGWMSSSTKPAGSSNSSGPASPSGSGGRSLLNGWPLGEELLVLVVDGRRRYRRFGDLGRRKPARSGWRPGHIGGLFPARVRRSRPQVRGLGRPQAEVGEIDPVGRCSDAGSGPLRDSGGLRRCRSPRWWRGRRRRNGAQLRAVAFRSTDKRGFRGRHRLKRRRLAEGAQRVAKTPRGRRAHHGLHVVSAIRQQRHLQRIRPDRIHRAAARPPAQRSAAPSLTPASRSPGCGRA